MLKDYTVKWTINSVGESPAEAALDAFAMMRDPESTATVMDVYTESGIEYWDCEDTDNPIFLSKDGSPRPDTKVVFPGTVEHIRACLEYLLESEAPHFIETFGSRLGELNYFEEIPQNHVFTPDEKTHIFYHAWQAYGQLNLENT